jgi:hypothetical protein
VLLPVYANLFIRRKKKGNRGIFRHFLPLTGSAGQEKQCSFRIYVKKSKKNIAVPKLMRSFVTE